MLAHLFTPHGSVSNMLLLRRALGLRGFLPWVIPVLGCHGNREQSNHLVAATYSSFSPCLEIELRQRNKASSITKGFSWDEHHGCNSDRTTSSLLNSPHFPAQTETT
ncbi:hypothetical protein AMECASPLE_024959 [Ameca splendens]|uniref:Uncharacterized protein n=1 Tax=Ameca splendens TaxID=208324 RepID=A0ABV0YFX4_9TELE